MYKEQDVKTLIGSVVKSVNDSCIKGDSVNTDILSVLLVLDKMTKYSLIQYNSGLTGYANKVDLLNKILLDLKYNCDSICTYENRNLPALSEAVKLVIEDKVITASVFPTTSFVTVYAFFSGKSSYTLLWEVISGDSRVVLIDEDTDELYLTELYAGIYEFKVTATTLSGVASHATMRLDVLYTPPVEYSTYSGDNFWTFDEFVFSPVGAFALPDSEVKNYLWTQEDPIEQIAQIQGANTLHPTFVLPNIPDTQSIFKLTTTYKDDGTLSDTSIVNQRPINEVYLRSKKPDPVNFGAQIPFAIEATLPHNDTSITEEVTMSFNLVFNGSSQSAEIEIENREIDASISTMVLNASNPYVVDTSPANTYYGDVSVAAAIYSYTLSGDWNDVECQVEVLSTTPAIPLSKHTKTVIKTIKNYDNIR